MSFKPHFSWEFLPADEIQSRSVRALVNHIDYLKRESQYYRELLTGVEPSDIESLEDLELIPLTDKDSLVENHSKFIVADADLIVESVLSNGSDGTPLLIPMTSSDLDRLAYNESLSFHAAGVTPQDRAQIVVGMDQLAIAGMSAYRGLIALGVNTTRIGQLTPEQHQHYFELTQPTILVGIPSHLLKIAQSLTGLGIDLPSNSIKKLFCTRESIRTENMELTETAQQLEELFGATIYSSYSSTEVSSTFCDCQERTGVHVHPELGYVEIIDENGSVVPDGEVGELVITPFGMEGLPLLRYRTGDFTFKINQRCRCGRNSVQLGPIIRDEVNSMTAMNEGTEISINVLQGILDDIPEMKDYIIELQGAVGTDTEKIFIHAAVPPALVRKIVTVIHGTLHTLIPVLISNKATIRSMRKDKTIESRMTDNRTGV